MIEVFHNGTLVSIINFGWESPDFYRKWMGCPREEDITLAMDGPSIDISSPNRVSPHGMLALFNALLDETWISKFKTHYAAVKRTLAEQESRPGKPNHRMDVDRETAPRRSAIPGKSPARSLIPLD